MKKTSLAAFVIAAMFAGQAQAALYGLASGSETIYVIDTATGLATAVSTLTPGSVSLSDLASYNNTLYASDVFGSSDLFGSVDPVTGAYVGINNQGGSINWHSLAADSLGNFYAMDLDLDNLVTFTLGGPVSIVGPTSSLYGLAFDAAGTLYGSDFNTLYTVDTSTGALTAVGDHNVGVQAHDLAFDPSSGKLFLYDGFHGLLYTLDAGTGAPTLIGGDGAENNIDGIAFANVTTGVPEPSTWLMAAGGLALLLRRRR